MVAPVQGDIYWVKFGHSGDSGLSGKRPAVVIQNNPLNRSNIQTTVVVLLTSSAKLAKVPGNVRLTKEAANLPKASVAVVSQIATVAKTRLIGKIGTLSREKLAEIIGGCRQIISMELFTGNNDQIAWMCRNNFDKLVDPAGPEAPADGSGSTNRRI